MMSWGPNWLTAKNWGWFFQNWTMCSESSSNRLHEDDVTLTTSSLGRRPVGTRRRQLEWLTNFVLGTFPEKKKELVWASFFWFSMKLMVRKRQNFLPFRFLKTIVEKWKISSHQKRKKIRQITSSKTVIFKNCAHNVVTFVKYISWNWNSTLTKIPWNQLFH